MPGSSKVDVRCDKNPFNTLLFRFDDTGIYVYCRDCRRGEKRGAEHFFSWGELLRMLVVGDGNDFNGVNQGRDNNSTES